MMGRGDNLKWRVCSLIVIFLVVSTAVLSEGAKVKSGLRKLEKTDDGAKKNGTGSFISSLFHVDQWIAPRFIAELTNTFSSAGLPATAMAGVGFIVLLPIYLASALVGWLPLKNIMGSTADDDDYGTYKAPINHYHAPSHGYHSEPPVKYGYPSATPSPHYGYPTSPTPSPSYGYPPAPSHDYGYHVPKSTTSSPQYGYPVPSSPAPHYGYPAAPAPHYGYSDTPAPQYGYQQASTSNQNNVYSSVDPSPPPTNAYTAIHSAPAPSTQYGPAPQPSAAYGISEPKTETSSRKRRSIGNENEDRCMERMACEISKATKGIKLPNWMNSLMPLVPWEQNEIIAGARRLFTESRGCGRFRCAAMDSQ